LDFHSTTGCIDCAGKFDKSTVAGGLHDTAAVFSDFGIDEFAPVRLERCESAFLVNAELSPNLGDGRDQAAAA
jgi:hypothetical protein